MAAASEGKIYCPLDNPRKMVSLGRGVPLRLGWKKGTRLLSTERTICEEKGINGKRQPKQGDWIVIFILFPFGGNIPQEI